MADFLPRKEIYDALNDIGGCGATDEWAKGYDSAIDTAINIIESMPAADVEPVRHGHWIEDKYGSVFECSECGYATDYFLTNYCPKCEAKMDGDTK